jgi:hypothetical protein
VLFNYETISTLLQHPLYHFFSRAQHVANEQEEKNNEIMKQTKKTQENEYLNTLSMFFPFQKKENELTNMHKKLI